MWFTQIKREKEWVQVIWQINDLSTRINSGIWATSEVKFYDAVIHYSIQYLEKNCKNGQNVKYIK